MDGDRIIPTMHRIDPAAMSEAQAGLIWRHLSAITECTPASRLADVFGKPAGRYWLRCPSDSHTEPEPRIYDMRVRWDPDRGVWAGHYGRLCEAAELGLICWHAYGVVLRIAVQFYDGLVPVVDDPLSAAAPADTSLPPPAPPQRSTTVGAAWYD